MKHFAKELATDILLMTAAIIGATWLLAALGAFHHPTPTQHGVTTHATTHIVACDHYLSHQAMVLNQIDHVGPVPAPYFCAVPTDEA